MNEIRSDQLNFNILRKFLFYKVLSSTLFLLISLNCWGEVATLSCLFSFQQHPKLNSLLSVVNLYLKLSGYNCSIHKVLWTRNWWLGGMIIWNFNEHWCKLAAHCMNLPFRWKKIKVLFLLFKPNFPLSSFTFPRLLTQWLWALIKVFNVIVSLTMWQF